MASDESEVIRSNISLIELDQAGSLETTKLPLIHEVSVCERLKRVSIQFKKKLIKYIFLKSSCIINSFFKESGIIIISFIM